MTEENQMVMVEGWGEVPHELLDIITKNVHDAYVLNIVTAFKEHEVDCPCESCKFLRVLGTKYNETEPKQGEYTV